VTAEKRSKWKIHILLHKCITGHGAGLFFARGYCVMPMCGMLYTKIATE